MRELLQDIRFTWRNLGRAPGVSATIILSLALGIGANTAVYSLFRGMLLQPLAVPSPSELVLIYWGTDGPLRGFSQSGDGAPRHSGWRSASRSFSYPLFRRMADRHAEANLFAFAPLGTGRQSITFAADGLAERVDGEMISGGYFSGLGIAPIQGRSLLDTDERTGARVAVISHAFWSRRFEADPSIIGRAVTLNDVPFGIVGVAPRGFSGVQPGRMPDVWVPFMDVRELAPWGARPDNAQTLLSRHDYWWVRVMGRVPPRDRANAKAILDTELRQYVSEHLPAQDAQAAPHAALEPAATGVDALRATYERPLKLLMGVMAAVLLVACANVAVLLLAQAVARRREIAVRLSLGATRARIVRQFLTESLVMAIAGSFLGVLVAAWTSRGLLMLVPAERRPMIDVPVDAGVFLFAVSIGIVTAAVFGLAPAFLAPRLNIQPSLKNTAGSSSEPRGHRAWSSTFVITQVAISLVLITAAALFGRSLGNLRREPLGLNPARVLVFAADATQAGYAGERLVQVYTEVLRKLRTVPGAESVTAARLRLFAGSLSLSPVTAAGAPQGRGGGVQWNAVGPEFAGTLGLRILAGRDLDWPDIEGRRRVALVNEAMARRVFGELTAVGRRFNFGDRSVPADEYEIVGVVANAKYSRVRGDFPPVAYVPFPTVADTLRGLSFEVRAANDPVALAPAVRDAVQRVAPRLAVVDLAAMPDQIDDSLWVERLFARLTSAFGVAAVVLACIGIYGTISYGVRRRRREIAVRMALGAPRAQVLALMLRRGVMLALCGIAAGLPLAIWAGRYIGSLLFEVEPSEPATILAVAGVLLAVASAAAFVPARRATLVDPALALKQE